MQFRRWCEIGLVLAAAATLAACGGGRDPIPPRQGASALHTALVSASARPEQRALATDATSSTPVTGDALADADQLLDFAEAQFPRWFNSPQRTRYFDGYLYRHYPDTGIYLGVRGAEVHVLGGEFGAQVRPVGPLTQFVTPQPPAPSQELPACFSQPAHWSGFDGEIVADGVVLFTLTDFHLVLVASRY